MSSITEVFNRMCKLNGDIKDLLKYAQYDDCQDLSGLDVNHNDPDEMMLNYELRKVFEGLDDVVGRISYLKLPIEGTSFIRLNQRGRYEREDGYEYTCGDSIEFLHPVDDYHEYPYWACSSVEAAGEYYIVHDKDVTMEGLTVRIRKPW